MSLEAAQVALMHGVHAQVTRPTLWIWFTPFSDGHLRRFRGLISDVTLAISLAFP